MKRNRFSRREFLQTTAGAAGATVAATSVFLNSEPLFASQEAVAASDRVRFGIVGVGMEGSGLLTTAIQLPGVECAAACDLYDGRHELAKEIVGKPIPTTRRYKDLLDNKEIDAIVVAVPDHWHKQVVVDALAAGKDVYCEKPFSHSPADGLALVEAAKKTDRIVQVGAQRTSSVLCAKAKELYDQGAIGELSLVEATLGRNDLIGGMQCVLGINEIPKRVSAFGGIYRWKDGRNTPDVHPVLFEYANVPVYMRLSLGTESTEVTRFMGSKGIIELGEFGVSYTPQAGIDLSPSYYASSFPSRLRTVYFNQWHAEHDPKPGQEPAPESLSFKGNDYDDLRPHLWKFFESVRSRKPVLQDAVFGHHAALGCHMANESYYRKKPVYWDAVSQTIKS